MRSKNPTTERVESTSSPGQDTILSLAAARLNEAAAMLQETAAMLSETAAMLTNDDRDSRATPLWVTKAVQWAKATVNNEDTKYEFGGTGPLAFDCSGFTQSAFTSGGEKLPRTAKLQHEAAHEYVSRAQARPGDLVFWYRDDSQSMISHVALVISGGENGKIAHARNEREGLSITRINYSPNRMLDKAARFHFD